MNQKPVIIVSGPTATGKTSVSIEISKKHNIEIVNFDSLLFYKELNIGVAKPSLKELETSPHHFVSTTSVNAPYNASSYSKMAIECINKIHQKGKGALLVGGSGFYLQAVLQGMYDSPSTPKPTLEKSEQLYKKEGIAPFLNILKESDSISFDRYHPNDHYRIRRAVEHYWTTGAPFSEQRKRKEQENQLKKNWPSEQYGWKLLHNYLDIPKEQHLKIIHERTRSMIAQGLEEEVGDLLKEFSPHEKPLQSIGYKEMIAYITGKIPTLEECEERINIATRQLAKAQRTWFNKKQKECYNPFFDKDKLHHNIQQFLMGN